MRVTLLAGGVTAALLTPVAHAQHFNAEFLKNIPGGQPVDLSYFEKNNDNPLPGVYSYDVRLLAKKRGTSAIRFRDDGTPCVTLSLLDMVGVDLDKLDKQAATSPAEGTNEAPSSAECLVLDQAIPEASYKVIATENAIDFTIPGQWLKANVSNDDVSFDPGSFTEGTTAGYLGYNLFGNDNVTRGAPSSLNLSGLLTYGLAGGEALRGWNVQGNANVQRQPGRKMALQNGDILATKDLVGLHDVVSVGNGSANSDFFGGYSFRGARLATDITMYPPSYGQIGPVISGVANTHAQITIYRDGRMVASRAVPPGPYVLDDMLPGAGSGTYEVVQREANGQETRWQIHFNSSIQLLHKGLWNYGATLGQLHHAANSKPLLETEASYGFTNRFTGSSGAVIHPRYRGLGAGTSVDLGLVGALTTTFSYAQSRRPTPGMPSHPVMSGSSIGLTYGKNAGPLTASLSASRNFGRYRTLQQATSSALTHADRGVDDLFAAPFPAGFVDGFLIKKQWNASLSAAMGHGYFNLSVDRARYQNGRSSQTETFSSSYSLPAIHGVPLGSFSVGFSRARLPGKKATGEVVATWIIPLGKRMTGSMTFTHVPGGVSNYSEQISSSRLGPDGAFTYSLGAQQPSRNSAGWNGNVRYTAPYTTLQGTYYQQGFDKSIQLGAMGSIVVHAGGVTSTNQPLTSSFVVVDTGHVSHVGILGQQNIRTDRFGYAIVPFATAYRAQQLDLDTRDLPNGVDVKNATYRIAGRNGAAIWAKYETYTNRRALLTLTAQDGKPVPFGAMAHDDEGQTVGWVGQDGKLFATGLSRHNRITVTWPNASCLIEFTLPEKATTVYDELSLNCTTLDDITLHQATTPDVLDTPVTTNDTKPADGEASHLTNPSPYGTIPTSAAKYASVIKTASSTVAHQAGLRHSANSHPPYARVNYATVQLAAASTPRRRIKSSRASKRHARVATTVAASSLAHSSQDVVDNPWPWNAPLLDQIYRRVSTSILSQVGLVLQILGDYLYQEIPNRTDTTQTTQQPVAKQS